MSDIVRPRASVRAALLEEHALLETFFTQAVEAAEAGVDKRSFGLLWARFERLLRRHMAAEETLLFVALARSHGAEIRHLRAEHDRLRAWLDEVDVAVDLHQARAPVVGALVEGLRAHAREEEEGLYRWAEAQLNSDRQAELLDRLQAELQAA